MLLSAYAFTQTALGKCGPGGAAIKKVIGFRCQEAEALESET